MNTLFLFRPTESTTVFLQQLGRGLRRTRHRTILTVLDVTGLQHPSFRFDRQLRELLDHSPRELREFVESGCGRLPSGCVLQFEERAQGDILERVRRDPDGRRGDPGALVAHRGDGWDLRRFLPPVEIERIDLRLGSTRTSSTPTSRSARPASSGSPRSTTTTAAAPPRARRAWCHATALRSRGEEGRTCA